MDGKKLVEAAKWAREHDGPGECEGCPLKPSGDCVVFEKLEATEPNVLACEIADAILAAYEWGKKECKARAWKWAKHYAEQYADRFAEEFQKAWVARILKAMDGEVKDAGVY